MGCVCSTDEDYAPPAAAVLPDHRGPEGTPSPPTQQQQQQQRQLRPQQPGVPLVSPLVVPDGAARDGDAEDGEAPIFELLPGEDGDTGAVPENRAVGGTAQAYRLSGLTRSDRGNNPFEGSRSRDRHRSGRPFALLTPPATSGYLNSSTLDASRLSNSNPPAGGGPVTQESSLARSVNDWMAEVSCHVESCAEGNDELHEHCMTPSAGPPTPPSPAAVPATARAEPEHIVLESSAEPRSPLITTHAMQ